MNALIEELKKTVVELREELQIYEKAITLWEKRSNSLHPNKTVQNLPKMKKKYKVKSKVNRKMNQSKFEIAVNALFQTLGNGEKVTSKEIDRFIEKNFNIKLYPGTTTRRMLPLINGNSEIKGNKTGPQRGAVWVYWKEVQLPYSPYSSINP